MSAARSRCPPHQGCTKSDTSTSSTLAAAPQGGPATPPTEQTPTGTAPKPDRARAAHPLVALNIHPKIAQRILRHSQIAMTMEVYAEASEEEVRAALGKLSEAMGRAG
ncbi:MULTISPECIES: hypothetical protein [unclassified Streptomyces]|uniref:hypothetical protein n=1 Tax=unclassified Streptomyces TaxID=2593676 RepID=UPI00227872DB|nr:MULTISPECIES: hypothetical protein [unclassified Streptomyces]